MGGIGIFGGVLMFISSLLDGLWWIQLAAMVPLLWAIFDKRPAWPATVLAGGLFGLFYAIPTCWALPLTTGMTTAFRGYEIMLWALFFTAAGGFANVPPIRRIAGVAGAAVLIGWLDMILQPFFGSALLPIHLWSTLPAALQITAWAGDPGLVFVITAINAAIALAIAQPEFWKQSLAAVVAMLLLWGGSALPVLAAQPHSSIKVASVSWKVPGRNRDLNTPASYVFRHLYRPLAEKAINQGAQLVVSRDMGFFLNHHSGASLYKKLGRLAKTHGVHLAVGYFNEERNERSLLLVDPDGYVNDHSRQPPFMFGLKIDVSEDGDLHITPNPSPLAETVQLPMLHLDDIARDHRRNGTNMLLSATDAGLGVGFYHYEDYIFHAVKNRYPVILAARGGMCGIVDARGIVQAEKIQLYDGWVHIVGTLPLYTMASPYSSSGNWLLHLTILCFLLWGVYSVVQRLRA